MSVLQMTPLVQTFQDSSGPFAEGEKGGGWGGGGMSKT